MTRQRGETLHAFVAFVVASAFLIILPAVEPTASDVRKQLRAHIGRGDLLRVRRYVRELAERPGVETTKAILTVARSLPASHDEAYWVLLEEVARFRQAEAFTAMGDFVVRNAKQPVAPDLLNALRTSDSKYLGRVIRRVLDRGPKTLQLMAVDLAPNAIVRRTVDILIPVAQEEHAKERDGKRPPTTLKRRLILALEALTTMSFGNDVDQWSSWWAANRKQGLRVLRAKEQKQRSRRLTRPIDPIRQRELIGVETLPPGKFLVIKGPIARNGYDTSLDHIEAVLARLAIPHDVETRDRLDDKTFSLAKYDAMFLNCTQINEFCQTPSHYHGRGSTVGRLSDPCPPDSKDPHDVVSFGLSGKAVEKLKRWAERGGHLFTEDWLLTDLIERAWGKHLGAGESLEGRTVAIRSGRGQTSHPYLRGVFVPPPASVQASDMDDTTGEYDPTVEDDPGDVDDPDRGRTGVTPKEKEEVEHREASEPLRHQWKIDPESPSLVVRSKKVRVLIQSPDLAEATKNNAVAVTFPVGRGRVLHVLSHFGRQGSADDEATIENLLVNFLIEVAGRIR